MLKSTKKISSLAKLSLKIGASKLTSKDVVTSSSKVIKPFIEKYKDVIKVLKDLKKEELSRSFVKDLAKFENAIKKKVEEGIKLSKEVEEFLKKNKEIVTVRDFMKLIDYENKAKVILLDILNSRNFLNILKKKYGKLKKFKVDVRFKLPLLEAFNYLLEKAKDKGLIDKTKATALKKVVNEVSRVNKKLANNLAQLVIEKVKILNELNELKKQVKNLKDPKLLDKVRKLEDEIKAIESKIKDILEENPFGKYEELKNIEVFIDYGVPPDYKTVVTAVVKPTGIVKDVHKALKKAISKVKKKVNKLLKEIDRKDGSLFKKLQLIKNGIEKIKDKVEMKTEKGIVEVTDTSATINSQLGTLAATAVKLATKEIEKSEGKSRKSVKVRIKLSDVKGDTVGKMELLVKPKASMDPTIVKKVMKKFIDLVKGKKLNFFLIPLSVNKFAIVPSPKNFKELKNLNFLFTFRFNLNKIPKINVTPKIDLKEINKIRTLPKYNLNLKVDLPAIPSIDFRIEIPPTMRVKKLPLIAIPGLLARGIRDKKVKVKDMPRYAPSLSALVYGIVQKVDPATYEYLKNKAWKLYDLRPIVVV